MNRDVPTCYGEHDTCDAIACEFDYSCFYETRTEEE